MRQITKGNAPVQEVDFFLENGEVRRLMTTSKELYALTPSGGTGGGSKFLSVPATAMDRYSFCHALRKPCVPQTTRRALSADEIGRLLQACAPHRIAGNSVPVRSARGRAPQSHQGSPGQSCAAKYETDERRLDVLELRDVCYALGLSPKR